MGVILPIQGRGMSFEPQEWWNTMKAIPPEISGPLAAFVIAIIRTVYDQSETTTVRVLLEASICSGLAVGAAAGIKAMDLNLNWIIAASTFIGFTGTMTLRVFMVRFLNSKVKKP